MRILHWLESFWPRIGGGEIFIRQLAGSLTENGHVCKVVTNLEKGLATHDILDGMEIFRFPFRESLIKRDLNTISKVSSQLKTLLDEFRPQIVHLHSSQSSAFFYLKLMKRRSYPTVYTQHNPIIIKKDPTPFLERIVDSSSLVITVSKAMRYELVRAIPAAFPKIKTILNSLRLPDVPPSPLDFRSPSLFCAARLVVEKGIGSLIGSMPVVLEAFPNIRLRIAGDGPIRSELEMLAQTLGVSSNIYFLGWISPKEIPKQINKNTIVIAPSHWEEPFGLIVLQAMQQGRPVVATRVGGIPELVQNGNTGLLVPPNNEEALSSAINRLLAFPQQAKEMGINGREQAVNEFNWDLCVDRYESVYEELI